MDKCAYHAKTRAVATCVQCKALVCATCRDEGERGVCAVCLNGKNTQAADTQSPPRRKESAGPKPFSRLPQDAAPPGPTPLSSGSHKGEPAASRRAVHAQQPERAREKPEFLARTRRDDIVYCFNHREIRATGPCAVCGRPFCPACVNTSATCGHCARNNEEALRQAFPTELHAEANARRAWFRQALNFVVVSVVLGGLGLAGWRLTHPAGGSRSSAPREEAPQQVGLTDSERALLANLKRERRVAMAETSDSRREAAPPRRLYAQQDTRAHGAAVGEVVGPVVFQALAPADGAIVGGQTYIRATLSGAPSRVVCEVDGVVLGTTAGAAPVFTWDTRKAGNGPHIITLTASGPGGGSTTTFTLNVMNR